MGANHLPCYGYDRNTAPNLCKFASENIFFRNAYSNAGWTLPSHFSIFTGLYPKHHGVELTTDSLSKKIPTLTQILKDNGYVTIWDGPTKDPSLPLNKGLGRGFDEIIYNPQYTVGWSEGIDELVKNSKQGKKTFLFLHTYWVHDPYIVGNVASSNSKRLFTNENASDIPTRYEDYSKFSQEFYDFLMSRLTSDKSHYHIINSFSKRQDLIAKLQASKDLYSKSLIFNQLVSFDDKVKYFRDYYESLLSRNNSSYVEAIYDEMIYYLDSNLKQIFSFIDSKEFKNNTILIITSDHGEEFMEHGYFLHPEDQLYNTTTSVPLIVRIPFLSYKVINNTVQSVDIYPTVLDLLGIYQSKDVSIDGKSLASQLLGKKNATKDNYVISEGLNVDTIRYGNWKLYVKNDANSLHNEYELYNLDKDPQEQDNVFKNYPQIIANLLENLRKIVYKR
ncbi:sulfatase-like hydrolase/transferase [Patescibacteria group bacterium]|nr:sulfatase-like hydrolase/transferase [Patescibacteria group bacterium]